MFRTVRLLARAAQLQGMRTGALARGIRSTPTVRSVTDFKKDDMFCMQCEQTRNGTGCSTIGVCGKTPEVAALQDLLVDKLKGIAFYGHRARQLGARSDEIDKFHLDALFATLTNVNFDPARFEVFIKQADKYRAMAKQMYEKAAANASVPVETSDWPAVTAPVSKPEEMQALARVVSVPNRFEAAKDDESMSLAELTMYGLKGLAAYAHHAGQLGHSSDNVYAFLHKALSALANPKPAAGEMLALALETGKTNVEVMAMLDKAHTTKFGNPTPAEVRTQPRAGKCILVSGHDLNDLHNILMQTEGKGIDVYTHGEMLPAHGYPGLRKFKHLAGNYGSAWQNQKFEFSEFPGPIVMTTNCLIEPMQDYKAHLYTRTVVGWPGCKHIAQDDYSEVIADALAMDGFDETLPAKPITVGFGHNTVLSIADKILAAVKQGDLKHVLFIGGCDGSEGERNYFKEVALGAPKDAVILTAGCGKYRFNKHDFGGLGATGIPRLLDVGQCNDSFGVVQIAAGLAQALNCGINDLPVSLFVSWFEQKAVAVLLSLLHLGVKNIYLGPKLPAFVTPAALNLLQSQYNLHKTGIAKDDLKVALARYSS